MKIKTVTTIINTTTIIITKITTNNYQNSNNNKKKSSPFIQKSLSSKRLQSVITIVVKCSIGRTKFPEISDIKKCEKVLLPAGKSKNIYIKWKELIT